jgi:hypothetical protein
VVILLAIASVATAQPTRPSSRPGGEIVPPPRRDVPGQRIRLDTGELFVPDFFKPAADGKVDVVIHFLGAAWCVEQTFYDARKNAVLLVASSKTLAEGFPAPDKFDALLAEVSRTVGKPIGKICLSSFSGGYTAVRDLLRQEPVVARVSDVVLLDSLYAPRVGENKDQLDPAAMQPFVDFASRAAEGRAMFFFTQLYPPLEQHRGNTTTLAASFVIDALKLERKPAGSGNHNSRGAKLLYRAQKNGCHILGYAGMTNQDHFEHLYGAADVWKLTSLQDAAPAGAGRAFFEESFDDADLAKRDWYDGTHVRIVPRDAAREVARERQATGDACIEYEWSARGAGVSGSAPVRHLVPPVDQLYVRFDLRLSEGWGWSGKNYHPHLLHLLTTENDRFAGPAATHLTLYIEPVDGKLRLAAQDIQNKDAPHGLTQGPLKGGYNGTFFDSRENLIRDDGAWHRIEAVFKLNTLDRAHGRPNADGVARAWFDGQVVVDHHDVVFRSIDFPDMKLNHLLLAPYFGPGLVPHAQKLWIDNLRVAPDPPNPIH